MSETITFNIDQIYKKLSHQNNHNLHSICDRLKEPFDVSSRITRSKNNLCKDNPKADQFLKLYEQLDTRNVHELNRFVVLLSLINKKPALVKLLKANKDEESKSKSTRNLLRNIPTSVLETSNQDIVRSSNIPIPGINSQNYISKFSTLDYIDPSMISLPFNHSIQISNLSRIDEENCIINDLINCLMNNSGNFVRPLELENNKRKFYIDDTMHKSFYEIVQNVTEVCNHISIIARFIDEYSSYEHGLVNQALAAAINAQLRQFRLGLCRVQSNHLMSNNRNNNSSGVTLSSLVTWLSGASQNLRTMAVLCGDTIIKNRLNGGTVLSALTKKLLASGSPEERKLLDHLLQCATVPFFQILRLWLYRGIIKDPYKEFFIYENSSGLVMATSRPNTSSTNELLTRADYWSKYYSINSSLIPKFLDNHVDRILDTGKYLNVIQLTGGDANFGAIQEMVYETEEHHYIVQIEQAYTHSSQLLMDILFKEKRLNDHFKFVKHYFLLNHADWLSHFMYLASNELNDFAAECQLTRLESLLDVAVQAGSGLNESLRDNLKVELSNDDLMLFIFNILSFKPDQTNSSFSSSGKNLRVLEAFSLTLTTEWPISLVFNAKVIQNYQILFRHLFYCHHVERVLSRIWLTNKCSNVRYLNNFRLINKANVLGGRMRTFVQHLLYYMTIEVIEPGWLHLQGQLTQARNLDLVFRAHDEFLQSCLMHCMLNDKELLKNLQKMMVLCVNYSNRFIRLLNSSSSAAKQEVLDRDSFQYEPRAFEQSVDTDDRNFTEIMTNLIVHIKKTKQYEKKLVNLVTRLEFNDFYNNLPSYASDVDN